MKRSDLSSIMSEAHRFIRIAGLSLSDALKKAWAVFKLKVSMSKGIVKFYFQKVDGTIREAYGTLNARFLPSVGVSGKKISNDTIQVYFDTEKQEWRSFKKMNLIY